MSTLPFTVPATVTLADQVEFNEHLLRRPDIRLRRALVVVGGTLIVPFGGVTLGLTLGYLFDNHPRTLADMVAQFIRLDLKAALVTTTAIAAGFGILRLFRRPLITRRLRRLLKDRPGVDPRDPELREPAVVTFAEGGYKVELTGVVQEVEWRVVRSLAESRSLLVLMTGRLAGNIIPKRDLSAEQERALRALVAERVGTPGQRNGGG